MTPDKVQDYLAHMQTATTDAISYIEGLDREDFLADRRTQQAVIMNLVIIGEAATRLMTQFPDFVQAQPHIPWMNMRGMRNRIAHGYFDLDLDAVWNTLTQSLPELSVQLNALDI